MTNVSRAGALMAGLNEANKFQVTLRTTVSNYAYLHHGGDAEGKVVEQEEFAEKNDANSYKREVIKKYKLKKYGSYFGSLDDGLELEQNY
jgi:hypothetical protein